MINNICSIIFVALLHCNTALGTDQFADIRSIPEDDGPSMIHMGVGRPSAPATLTDGDYEHVGLAYEGPLRVAQIDGGGARIAFAAEAVAQLEEQSGKQFHKLFPGGITGTSAGALMAAALSVKKHYDQAANQFVDGPYTGRQLVGLCQEFAKKIFCFKNARKIRTLNGLLGPRYKTKALKKFLFTIFGNQRLRDVRIPIQIVTREISRNKTLFLTERSHPNMLIRDALLASTSAPTFFQMAEIDDGEGNTLYCVDGGTSDNSAVIKAASRTKKLFGVDDMDSIYLFSIGTGIQKGVDNSRRLRKAGILQWIRPLIDIAMDSDAEVKEEALEEIYGTTGRYYRFQTAVFNMPLDQYRAVPRLTAEAKRMALRPEFQTFMRNFGFIE